MLRICLKVASRTRRWLELPLPEDIFAALRRIYWNKPCVLPDHQLEHIFDNAYAPLTSSQRTILKHAVEAVSIWVGGIYWYKGRTPKASPHTRVRTFPVEDKVECPRCEFLLVDGKSYQEEPVAYSKTLKNPRFICPHCNAYVVVSSRREDYQNQSKRT